MRDDPAEIVRRDWRGRVGYDEKDLEEWRKQNKKRRRRRPKIFMKQLFTPNYDGTDDPSSIPVRKRNFTKL